MNVHLTLILPLFYPQMKTIYSLIAASLFTATVIVSYFVYCLWWVGKKIDEERRN